MEPKPCGRVTSQDISTCSLTLQFRSKAHVKKGVKMDKDRIAGSAKVVKGKVKEAAGKVIGDAKLNAEGKADQAEGKVQNAVGGVKDALRGK